METAANDALSKGIKLTASHLSAQVFLSDRQLSRRLTALTGLNAQQYIQEVKLQKARHLLEHKVLGTVAEVAHAAGFGSPSYLSKLFRERFGKLPGAYL